MSTPSRKNPVFYDPNQRRWLFFKVAAGAFTALFFLIFFNLVSTLLSQNPLPQIAIEKLQELSHGKSPLAAQPNHLSLPPKEVSYQQTKSTLLQFLKQSTKKNALLPKGQTFKSNLVGFFVNWDDTSYTSLKANIASLDVLMPEWLHLTDETGKIELDNAQRQKFVLKYIQSTKPSLEIIPLINNYDSATSNWKSDVLAKMLANQTSRQKNIQLLLSYIEGNHFQGISIDYENIPTASQDNLVQYMTELSTVFHAHQLRVAQSVPIDDNNFNYKKLADLTDSLILMAYDEHWSTGTAGPIASETWFESKVQKVLKVVPSSKAIIAIGNYGYDWKDKSSSASEVTFQDVVQTAKESDAVPGLSQTSLNMTFDYTDDTNTLHHVWFLDGVSAFNEFSAGASFHPQGWALWRLGSEDPSFWNIANARDNQSASSAAQLQNLRYGYDVDYEGKGEVLKVTDTPKDGSRDVIFDSQLGLITASKMTKFPSPYVITRWGGENDKKIALTFDDGPDPQYTEKILAILKQYNVPATFFIIGQNADLYPNILDKINQGGFEIGVHTYTHPNISHITQSQLSLELNATQRLLESRIGRSSLLFRPPYAEDIEPSTPDQVKPLVFTSQLGYYTIGLKIDPQDWQVPSSDQIVASTVEQTEAGNGNVVLLHDGGGDRSHTVEALPKIIEGLRAKGYQLVSVPELMKLKRDDVMPPITGGRAFAPTVTGFGFSVLQWFSLITQFLFWSGIVLGTARLVFVTVLAIVQAFSKRQKYIPDSSNDLSVSVLVPTYNEEKVIVKTIEALLQSAYPNIDIYIIDDGSTDRTVAVIQEAFLNETRVHLFPIANRGKGDALNYGLEQTTADIIVAIDADTLLESHAISKLVRHFADPQVGAVAGNAKVGNRISLLTRWQALEYITSQNLDRRAFAVLNCITVVPGAIGAWRRTLVRSVGGFSTATLAEDADLTLSILENGFRIHYEDEAVAYTEAPIKITGFLKQRFRWSFGTMQVIAKHRSSFFSVKLKHLQLTLIALPNLLIFQIFFPIVSPIMDVLFVTSILQIFLQKAQHPADASPAYLKNMLVYYVLFIVLDYSAAIIAFALEKKENWTLLFWLFSQRFLYRQLMYYVVIKSVIVAIRGSLVGWNKLEREGMEMKL